MARFIITKGNNITIKGVPTAACILGATYLAANHCDGWGWLLLLGLLLT